MAQTNFSFETFVSKYLYDPAFKAAAEKDLKGAIKSLGVEITPQIQNAIDTLTKNNSMTDLAKLAGALDNNFVGMT